MVQGGNPQIILVDFLSCVGAVEGLRSLRQPEYSEYSTTEDTPIDLGGKTVLCEGIGKWRCGSRGREKMRD